MTRRVSSIGGSIAAAVVTYGCARAGDALFLRVVRPPRGEVLLVSDVILATAFGVAVYLWLDLRATRTRLTGLERTQIALDAQLSLAAQIQRHLLPPIPVESNGVRWAGRLEPANRIGGDFYDFIPDAGGLFVVGDVSGKGIPAALLQASDLALRAADQNSRQEHQHASQNHLKGCGEERGVHVAVTDVADGCQFNSNDTHGERHGDGEIRNEEEAKSAKIHWSKSSGTTTL